MRDQTVLIVGAGGREHALAWKLAQSLQVKHIIVAPGNGGTTWQATDTLASCESADIAVEDFDDLLQLAKKQKVSLTVVGPEVPLALGIVDLFEEQGFRIFGVSKAAAQLEASKSFSRDFMKNVGIPSPAYGIFQDEVSANDFIRDFGKPVVVKASGLAAGKGVLVCDTPEEAQDAVRQILGDKAFGAAGDEIVIEERLNGDEFSVLAFCDGKTAIPMMIARDHKRALDGDRGLNTGGMGAYAPATDITPDEIDDICQRVLQPTVDAMAEQGTPYHGILYAGIMRSDESIKVLEFNCRFGDPETQVVLPMLNSNLFTLMNACVDGTLDSQTIEWHDGTCATVVLASGGYPESYLKGKPITIENPSYDIQIFHAGTAVKGSQLVTSGGRVLAITARGDQLASTLDTIYAQIGDNVSFDKMHYRTDIGRTNLESIL
jgi:phosphoribosylamine---glycine ligase